MRLNAWLPYLAFIKLIPDKARFENCLQNLAHQARTKKFYNEIFCEGPSSKVKKIYGVIKLVIGALQRHKILSIGIPLYDIPKTHAFEKIALKLIISQCEATTAGVE